MAQANSDFCSFCQTNHTSDYQRVREYLRENPNRTPMEIANATGVSISKILRYVRSGSFTIVNRDR
nr:winged helix-turn-helix domain-containing protein [Brevibacillus fulvus]